MNEKMIKIDNIVKRYGSFVALDHLKLEIREGEIFGLLGPNGSGKTTTISCLLALLRYDKGEIDIFGEKMTPDSYELKKNIGIVPQEIAVFDEPTVAVDPQSRNSILEGIKRLNKNGATIIYTSHYMEEVEQICSKIAIIDKGQCIAYGTKEELKKMIKTGETITLEGIMLEAENIKEIGNIPHVFDVSYNEQTLVVRCTGAKHNLIRILEYMNNKDISFGRVFSELPTLNDVFLEITGKKLRD